MNKHLLFSLVLVLSAVVIAFIAAFFSVFGLSKLFAGGIFVLLLFASLEVGKIVVVSYIYQYWKTILKTLRIYYITAVFILMLITSLGIYSFLTNSYQSTHNKLTTNTNKIELLENKKNNYQEQLDIYNEEKKSSNEAISQLRTGLSKNVIQYKDPETGEIITTTSSANRRSLESQLDKAIERQSTINTKTDDLNTKIFDVETEIMEVNNDSEVGSELGPLKYLSQLTGYAMDKIVNVLTLLIIFVFDPFAVGLIIAANQVYAIFITERKKKKENQEEEKEEDHDLHHEHDHKEIGIIQSDVERITPVRIKKKPPTIDDELINNKTIDEYTDDMISVNDDYIEDLVNNNVNEITEVEVDEEDDDKIIEEMIKEKEEKKK